MWRAGSVARVVLAAGLGAVLEAVAQWLLGRWRPTPAREVIFFPSRLTCTEELLVEAAGAPSVSCSCPLPHGDSQLRRLLTRVLSARRSLDLCLFAFTCPQLGKAVLGLHQRGVRVRVVTDVDYTVLRGSQIGLLRQAGIQVRHDQERGHMHHKFAIIDKKILVTGSLNWTTQAIQTNRENVLILEDPEYVQLFLAEFDKLWACYNPDNYTFFLKEAKQVLK